MSKNVARTLIATTYEADNVIKIHAVKQSCECCNTSKMRYQFQVFTREASEELSCFSESYFDTLNEAFEELESFLICEYKESIFKQ